jgi:phage shock protein PspC (stress-responsive transcriptional regulator)
MSDSPPPPEQREAAFFSAIRNWGIMRNRDAFFGGVASGVGERIGLARVPARLVLVVATIVLSGIVPLAYAAAWALLPDRDGNIIIQNFGRGITNVGALIGIAIFGLIGAFNLDPGWGRNGLNIGWSSADVSGLGRFDGVLTILFGFLAVGFGLLVVGGLVFAIVYSIRRGKRPSAPRSGPYAVPPQSGSSDPDNPVVVPGGSESTEAASSAVPEGTFPPPAAANPGQPQPWEAAVMPGDSSVTGATTTSAAWNGTHRASVPPVPPRPPLRRVPGPGRRFYLITAAWLVISIAIIMVTNRVDGLAVAPGLAWLALFTVGFGLILAAIAVSGRKLGFLGFLSIPLLLAGLVTAVNSGEIRDAFDTVSVQFETGGSTDYWIDGTHYDSDGNILDETPYEDPTVTDPTVAFAGDYQQIYVAPQCYAWDAMQPGAGQFSNATSEPNPEVSGQPSSGYSDIYASQARFTYATLDADTTVDVIAEHTVLTIPSNTNLILRAETNAQSTIDWESRGLHCEFWEGDQDNLSLVNTGAPTLTLLVRDDQYANTIEVHETPAVVAEPASTPDPTSSSQPTVAPEGNQS